MDVIMMKALAKGLLTYIPAIDKIYRRGTGGSLSARYCYGVWLRHLETARLARVWNNPKCIAELGPGDSLGVGLAALLTGVDRYYAFDAKRYASVRTSLPVFEGLLDLFRQRERIPDDHEFPELKPELDSYEFPHDALPDQLLAESLKEERVQRIRQELMECDYSRRESISVPSVHYIVPWESQSENVSRAFDMIFSQAVLEHVNDLDLTYRMLARWIRPGGFMSHQIDFRSHDTTSRWNGHWTFNDSVWSLIKGKRMYLLNREPYSRHVERQQKHGFMVTLCQAVRTDSAIGRDQLASRFGSLTDEDLSISGAFVISVKSPGVL